MTTALEKAEEQIKKLEAQLAKAPTINHIHKLNPVTLDNDDHDHVKALEWKNVADIRQIDLTKAELLLEVCPYLRDAPSAAGIPN